MTAPARHEARLTICNEKGLHARAAAKFVKCADGFDARILVSKGGVEVGGDSIMGLMLLAASKGCGIDVAAEGPEAEAALVALTTLVDNRFDEDR